MRVSELCIVMLAAIATRIECEGEEFDNMFEFNDKYGSRTIKSVERIFEDEKDDVLVKVRLEDEDWILDALAGDEEVEDETH